MGQNLDTVRRYIDGFVRSDREQILGCLTDDIQWIVRLVEQDDVVMGELAGSVHRADGSLMRMNMAETWVMRDGLICERRSWVVELTENDVR